MAKRYTLKVAAPATDEVVPLTPSTPPKPTTAGAMCSACWTGTHECDGFTRTRKRLDGTKYRCSPCLCAQRQHTMERPWDPIDMMDPLDLTPNDTPNTEEHE